MSKSDSSPKLILASQSPRRRYLLEQAGIEFSVIPSSFDESSIRLSSPDSYVRQLAESKAREISEKFPASWVIGADTIVLINGTIMGKPGSKSEARAMLECLSGNIHQVLTGYCICCKSAGRSLTDAVETEVEFKQLSMEEIDWYLDSGEPFDKAGAYAIQGIGTFLVRRINGSYTNVVGLPVCEIVEFLISENIVKLTS